MSLHHLNRRAGALRRAILLAALGMSMPLAVQAQSASSLHSFNVPEQSLDSALTRIADQGGVRIFFASQELEGYRSVAVDGSMSIEQALQQALHGSGFGWRYDAEGIVLIEPVQAGQAAIQLSPISIQGTRPTGDDSDWVYHEPRSVSVITREDIDKRPPRHAADMLIDTPGVANAVDRNNPSLSVNIRGMQDFGRVNMMIDGMRQNHVESGHQQRNGEMYIDSELLSSVVIEKGPNASVHGANAIAGSANFQTLDYDDIILPGQDQGVRLRGMTGVGGYVNGSHFLGSAAVAGRFDERLELLVARSQKKLGQYSIGDRGRNIPTSVDGQEIREMRYSDQQQDSWLAKARLKLADDQRLQFTYTGTDISYNNTSDWDPQNSNGNTSYGSAEAQSRSYALDYNFSPANNSLIDLNAKVYFVSTENERINDPRPNATADFVWNSGYCLEDPLSSTWQPSCLAGMRNTTISRTDTWGLQLENTSTFDIGMLGAELSANYGVEWFQDEGKSSNKSGRDGVSTSYLDGLTASNLNPNGRRDVASAFASLTFSKDPVTLKAGLRYDWYGLRGSTTVPGSKSSYSDRLQKYMNYYCPRPSASARRYCSAAQQGGREAAIAAMAEDSSYAAALAHFEQSRYNPEWTDTPYRYEYDVDRTQGRFSPFLSAAYKPLSWLELFGNWGKGFRPPAMTETLWEGDHGGSSSSHMYPNPLLDSERSTSWEVGLNTLFQNLLRNGDQLGMKIAYFDTRVDSFVFTNMRNSLPGTVAGSGLGNTFFTNNLVETKFRGIELEGVYNAQLWYAGANFTKYLSNENDFCGKIFPLGSQRSSYDYANEDGSMTSRHQQAIEAGYGSYEEYLDNMRYCGIDLVMNATRSIPMDRHGATLGLRLFDKKLDMGIRYNRSRGDAPSNWNTTDNLWDSYTTWDFYSKYQPTQNLVVSLVVENIRDENYLGGYSDMLARTYAPGRTVQAGVEVRF